MSKKRWLIVPLCAVLCSQGLFAQTLDRRVLGIDEMFRLADVYLMMAEAVVRGGTGSDRGTVLGYINELQRRAYGDDEHKIADSDLTLDFLLKERARELYWEGHRRTDLIRYGMFTTDKYLWQWKGGEKGGTAVNSKYNIYPIPNTELTANPNLYNENY